MQDPIARARDGLRRMQPMRLLFAAGLAMALAACQAASPPPVASGAAESPPPAPGASTASRSPPPAAATDDAPAPDDARPATPESPAAGAASPPAPAPVARAAGPSQGDSPGGDHARALDDRCSSDADCEVKDVGSCCGYRPRCLHRDSPTFAEEVKARCRAEGRVGHCGIAAVAGCACEAGRCVSVNPTDNMLVQ